MNNQEFVDKLKKNNKGEETKLQRKIQKYLEENNCYHFKVHGSNYMRAGIPDIICCYKGKFIGIECKIGKNKMSPIQEKHKQEIEESQGIHILAYSLDDVKKIIENL